MKTVKTLMLIISLLFMGKLYAQQTTNDAVYLKNGGLIRGKILEYIPQSFVKIKTETDSIWTFKGDEIDRVVLGETTSTAPNPKKPKEVYSPKGYNMSLSLGVIPSGDRNYFPAISLRMTNSYSIIPSLMAGICTGIERFDATLVPIAADIRYMPMVGRRTNPVLYAQAGYSIPINGTSNNVWNGIDFGEKYQGGANAALGVSLLRSLGEHSAFTIGMGWRYQHFTSTQNRWDGAVLENSYTYRRIEIRLGFMFN